MEPTIKPRKLRLLSGDYHAVEEQLNALLDEYTAIAWNFVEVSDDLRVTVVLVHSSVLRQQQLAQVAMGRPQ